MVATCGVLLILWGCIPKIGRSSPACPDPVIGGAATVMFAMVTAVGIQTLHKVNFKGNHNLLIVAVSLSFGMIPAVAPTFYHNFPSEFQVIFGSGITSTVIVVFILNLVFNHWIPSPKGSVTGGHLPQYGAEVDVTADGVADPERETRSTPDNLVADDPTA